MQTYTEHQQRKTSLLGKVKYILTFAVFIFSIQHAIAQMPIPNALSVSSIGSTSAVLNWLPGGTEINWEVSYDLSPLSIPSSGMLSTEWFTTKNLTGLVCNTSYDYYVRAWANGQFSAWAGPYTFTTASCCTPCNQTNHVDSLLINTGYDIPSSAVLPAGSADLKWKLIAAPIGASISVPVNATVINSFCVAPAFVFPNSNWISMVNGNSYFTTNSFSEPFTFQYDFCLCEDDSVEFNLKGMIDDTMRVYIDAFLYEFPTVSFPAAGFNTHNYGITKVFLPKGKHTLNVDLFNLNGPCVGFDLVGKIKSAHLLEHGSCNSSFVFNNPIVAASASAYTLCAGASSTLNATGATSYVWEPGTLSGSTHLVTPSATTTYTVTGTNSSGCTDTKTVTIVVNPKPIMGVTAIDADCSGSGGFTFLPTAGTAPFDIQINPCPGFPYCNYTGVTLAGLTTTRVYTPGTYTITTTDANGCTHITTATINPSVALGINLLPHQPLCCGGNGAFSFGGLNPLYYYTFTISPCPLGAPCTYVTNGLSTGFFFPAGTYTITMTDSSGCSTSVVTTLNDPFPCLQATASLAPCTVCIKPVSDALIHELLPTSNFGTVNPIRASRHTYGGTWASTRGLFQFDLSSIPPGSVITNATITLKSCTNCVPGYNQHYDLGGGTGNWGVLRRVVAPWTEAGVTWSTAPLTTGLGLVITPSYGTSTLPLVENITTMAQYWFANPALNYGFELALGNNADYYHGILFGSRENADTNLQPSLCITYEAPIPQIQSVCITASEDAMLSEFIPTLNYGGFNNLRASQHTYGGTWASTKSLFKFDMSSLPAGALITAATMTLSTCYDCVPYYTHYDLGGGTGNNALIKQVTSPWSEFGVTWNTAPSTTIVGAFTTANFGHNTSTSLVQSGMQSLAQSWFKNPSLNHGVELSMVDPNNYYHGVFFGSRETTYPAYRPKICIDYIMPSACNQILCNGGTMNINVGATGGTPFYAGTGTYTAGAGPFSYTVIDANGCSSTVSGTLYEPAPIETVIKLDTCDNYFWPANGSVFTSSGIYSHVFTAANGCDSTVTLDLTLHAPPPTTVLSISSCGPYVYPANGIYYLASTQFSYLGGKDKYGCDSLFIVNIIINPIPTLYVTPYAANCITGLGAFDLMASGGTAPYTINVSPCPSICSYGGFGISTPHIYPIGTYTITVIDANGCTATTTATITGSPALTINLITHPPYCSSGNGAFSFSGPNPFDTYTFSINPCPIGAPCSYSTSGLSTSYFYPPGNYTITITDVNGCTATTSTIINLGPPPLNMNLIVHQPFCGTSNGAFSFSGPNLSQTYTFSISPCPLGAPCTYTTSGISTSYLYPAGTYTITITDVNGCTGTSIAVISIPPLCANTNSLIINTGYDPVTNLVLSGAGLADPLWSITAVGGSVFTPAVTTSFNPAGSASCRAISNSTNEISFGQRIYRREFKMGTNDNIVFDLNLAYDNWINGIYIDGVLVTTPTTITPPIDYTNPSNFSFFHNYNFTKYLTAGSHTIDVYLFNQGGVTILKIFGTLTGTSSSLVTNTSPANCCFPAQALTSTGTIKVFSQGYYTGNGVMTPVLSNQGVGVSAIETDSMIVELHESTAPYTLVSSFKQIVKNNGNCDFNFPSTLIGNAYYVAVKHRNSIQTWSSNPIILSPNQTTYDFTSSAAQAHGSNLYEVESGVWAMYTGDINQDGAIDAFDYLLLDPDILIGNSGYLSTDLNGDGSVDAFDYLILDLGILNGIGVSMP